MRERAQNQRVGAAWQAYRVGNRCRLRIRLARAGRPGRRCLGMYAAIRDPRFLETSPWLVAHTERQVQRRG